MAFIVFEWEYIVDCAYLCKGVNTYSVTFRYYNSRLLWVNGTIDYYTRQLRWELLWVVGVIRRPNCFCMIIQSIST